MKVTDYIDTRYEFTEELIWPAAQTVALLGGARGRDERLLVQANDEIAGAMSRRKTDERELVPTFSGPETSVLPLSQRPARFLRGPIRHAIP